MIRTADSRTHAGAAADRGFSYLTNYELTHID
jgi:hypothetical protein